MTVPFTFTAVIGFLTNSGANLPNWPSVLLLSEDIIFGLLIDLSKLQRRQQGGYECKYCPFSTQNLNTFKEHVDANHPNVILNPLYLCAVCNFNTKKFDTLTEHNERCHPGESNFKFKRIKMNNQTILEQTIEGCSNNAIIYNSSSTVSAKGEEHGALPMSKSTTAKIDLN